MVTRKTLFTSLLFIIFVIIIFICHKSRNTLFHCSPLSQTCLTSFDARALQKSLFHLTRIHFNVPTTLNHWVQNKIGLDIGGPSHATWGNLGVYDAVAKMDVTNFASNTLWESGLKDGAPFIWKNQIKGRQYIRDAVDLTDISNEFYDVILASHVLEHITNPFKAFLECLRIMRSGGLLIIIVPFKTATFDHKRDVVRIEHLIDDYRNEISESDLSHLSDILVCMIWDEIHQQAIPNLFEYDRKKTLKIVVYTNMSMIKSFFIIYMSA
jgi:predicted SAM-dependent methyltransferase